MRKQRAEQYNQNVLNYTNNIIIWTDTTSQILKRTQKYQPYGVTVNLPVVVGISCQIFFHIFLSKQRLKFLPRIVVTVSGSRFNCKIYSVTLWNILKTNWTGLLSLSAKCLLYFENFSHVCVQVWPQYGPVQAWTCRREHLSHSALSWSALWQPQVSKCGHRAKRSFRGVWRGHQELRGDQD